MSKTVVIIGGASGIGKATALLFSEKSYRVLVVDRDKDKLKKLGSNSNILIVSADISKLDQLESAFREIDGLLDHIDVFIANAGISIRRDFLDTTFNDFDETVHTNLRGIFFCVQYAAKRMIDQDKGGRILMTGSINGIQGFKHYSAYNLTKAGLINLGKTLALELPPKINTVVISPGAVWTPMQEREYTEEMKLEVEKAIPAGRHATSEEMAESFFTFSNEKLKFVNGANIVVDGGETSGNFLA